MQVEFRNAAANSTASNTEILASGCLVLIRENQGFFAMCPDGIMDEVINTGGWAMGTVGGPRRYSTYVHFRGLEWVREAHTEEI